MIKKWRSADKISRRKFSNTVSHKILIKNLMKYGLVGQWGMPKTLWMAEPRGWKPVMQRSVLSSVVFSVFVNDLDDWAECTPSVWWLKLKGVANVAEDCASIQRNLHTLEKWADKNSVLFNKGMCQVLYVRKTCTLGTRTCWGPSSWKAALQKKNLGI